MPYRYAKSKQYGSRLIELGGWLFLTALNAFDRFFKKPAEVTFLIVEPFQMGDLISTSVLLDPLKESFPGCKIYILTKSQNAFVFANDTRVEQTFVAEVPWSDYGPKKGTVQRWFSLFKETWKLRKYSFHTGIDCRGDIRSQLLMVLSGCYNRVGYRNYLNSNINLKGLLLTHKIGAAPYDHRYDWNRYILTALGIPSKKLFPIKFPTLQADACEKMPQVTSSDYLLVHIGGGWVYKRWPVKNWINLINWLDAAFTSKVVVIAGPGEKDILAEIQASVNETSSVTFQLPTYSEMLCLIKSSRLFIGLDSGPMNIATCLEKPVIALFGPGDSDTWYPYSSSSKYLHKKEMYPCNPCAQLKCYFPSNSCMMAINWSEVKALIEQTL